MSSSFLLVEELRGDLGGDVRVELEPAAEERAADRAGREQGRRRQRRRGRRRRRRGCCCCCCCCFRFFLTSQLSLLFFFFSSSPLATPFFLFLFAIQRGVVISTSGEQVEQERLGPVGVVSRRGKGTEFRLGFERSRAKKHFPLDSHLSFSVASGASLRELDAADALELFVTVTPKRRSDCWTARSAMIFPFFVCDTGNASILLSLALSLFSLDTKQTKKLAAYLSSSAKEEEERGERPRSGDAHV